MPSPLNESANQPEALSDEIRKLSDEFAKLNEEEISRFSIAKRYEDFGPPNFFAMASIERRMKKIRDRIYDVMSKLAEINPEHPLVKDFLQQFKDSLQQKKAV